MRFFTLETVLFPLGALPLHVFESRYRIMVLEALQDDSTFGVALIERGSEVGVNEQRFNVGTVARIVRAGRIDESRLAVVALGVDRIRITEWLDDSPYPSAMMKVFPDGAETPELESAVERARRTLRRLIAFASELGASVGKVDLNLPTSLRDAVWMLCSVAPVGQLDRQRLLEIEDPAPRLEELQKLLDESTEALQAQLAGG